MWLDDLADAARGSGLTVHELAGWRGRDHGAMSAVRGVICHHTGSSGAGAENVVRDGRSDLQGPLAQLSLRRDGSVGVIAHGQAWHAGTGSWASIGRNNGNANCIGIEAVYNGSDLTDAQRRAYPRLVAALCRHYRIPVGNVIGHREWAPDRKVDPGQIDMAAFRREVAGLVSAPATTTDQEDDMTPEQDRMLREVHAQLTTAFPAWRWGLPQGAAQPKATLVDFIRGLDQIVASRFTLTGRPVEAEKDDTSTGHLLSLRSEVADLARRVSAFVTPSKES